MPKWIPKNLKDLMVYSEEHKGLIWKTNRGTHGKKGTLVGAKLANGKRVVKVDGIMYHVDDLVWYWHHGEISVHPLVHIDGDWSNNSIKNLRQETSIKRRWHSKVDKRKSTALLPGAENDDSDIKPEEKLVAAIIKNALWHAKRDMKKSKLPFQRAVAMSEPARFITGQDDGLEYLTSVSQIDTDAVISLAYKVLKEVHGNGR